MTYALRPFLLSFLKTEIKISWTNLSRSIQPLLFILLVCTLFPLSLTPSSETLRLIGPGIIWVSALLANFLSLEHLFAPDYSSGWIEQWCLSPFPLSLIVSVKVFAHWLTVAVPIIVATPFLGLAYHLTLGEINAVMISLLLGTPGLILIGAIGHAMLVKTSNSGVLLALLVIPLYIPVLIFGAGSVTALSQGISPVAAYAVLAALSLFSMGLAPLAIAGSLRLAL